MEQKKVPKCLYPRCEALPKCHYEGRGEYSGDHFSYEPGSCSELDYEYATHKWICDEHWDLLQFIKDSDVLEFDED